jgi:chromosome segregation ATPase
MVEVKTHRDHPASMSERIAKRERNSGDTSHADVVRKSDAQGSNYHNIHNSRVHSYGEDRSGVDIHGNVRGPANPKGEIRAMTRIDDLPDEVEKVADLVRSTFAREISSGRKAADELKVEAATIKAEVSTVQTQLKQAQADLKATLGHQSKASELVLLSSKAATLRQEVEKLTAEKAALATEVADLAKKKGALEAEVTGLADDARSYRAERADFEGAIGRARALANNWRTQ